MLQTLQKARGIEEHKGKKREELKPPFLYLLGFDPSIRRSFNQEMASQSPYLRLVCLVSLQCQQWQELPCLESQVEALQILELQPLH